MGDTEWVAGVEGKSKGGRVSNRRKRKTTQPKSYTPKREKERCNVGLLLNGVGAARLWLFGWVPFVALLTFVVLLQCFWSFSASFRFET